MGRLIYSTAALALLVTIRAGRMAAVKAAETVVGLRRKLAQLLPSFIASLPPIRLDLSGVKMGRSEFSMIRVRPV